MGTRQLAYLALRHTLLQGRVLRSADPAGLEQELWALLALYQSLRRAMVTAVETVPGTDPDRASFTALTTAQDLLVRGQKRHHDGGVSPRTAAPLLTRHPGITLHQRPQGPARSRYNKKDPYRPTRPRSPP